MDLFSRITVMLPASSLGRLLCSSREAELKVRLLLPAVVQQRGWLLGDPSVNVLSSLHLFELWDLIANMANPAGVHYMLLRHTVHGTTLELQLSEGRTSLGLFRFCASDAAEPMW